MTNLTTTQLKQALTIREKIDALESELAGLLGAAPAARRGRPRGKSKEANGVVKPRRKMSAAAKARIAASARKRWKLAKAAGKTTLGG